MSYLVDTCVISELIKPRPDPSAIARLRRIDSRQLFLSVITIGELEKGVAMLPQSKKKKRLTLWLAQLVESFKHRLLPFDIECAREWGRIQAKNETPPVVDAMIAATALVNAMTVVTGDADLERCGVAVLNPWSESA